MAYLPVVDVASKAVRAVPSLYLAAYFISPPPKSNISYANLKSAKPLDALYAAAAKPAEFDPLSQK